MNLCRWETLHAECLREIPFRVWVRGYLLGDMGIFPDNLIPFEMPVILH